MPRGVLSHQPFTPFDVAQHPTHDAEGRPIFEVAAYIDAMRAVGAKPRPVRGKPGRGLDETFTVDLPAGAAARRRVAAIENAFAPGRVADPAADRRVAYFLFEEDARNRFVSIVGHDLAAAIRELARRSGVLETAAKAESQVIEDGLEDDPASHDILRAVELAGEDYQAAFDHVLAMPVRRKGDLSRKAEFALRFCCTDDDLKKVLVDIAAFGAPETVGTLPDIPAIAA